MLKFNGKVMKFGNVWGASGPVTPPAPVFEEVTIGTQTWMAKNLAVDDGGAGIVHFDNVTANGVNFGTQYFYTVDAAIRIAASVNGWHLPTQSEFEELAATAGGMNTYGTATKLKSTTGWTGTQGSNIYGFNALPVGFVNGDLTNTGSNAIFMSATKPTGTQPWTMSMTGSSEFLYKGTIQASMYTSVRLVKDVA